MPQCPLCVWFLHVLPQCVCRFEVFGPDWLRGRDERAKFMIREAQKTLTLAGSGTAAVPSKHRAF
jgi:hypothetical protein